MSSSAINNNNQVAANPFSNWKSTVNLDPNNTGESNMPDEIATLIFSKMTIEKVSEIMESTETLMDRYALYRNLISAKSSLTGKELDTFQKLLSMEGQALIAGQAPEIKSWATLLEVSPISLTKLTHLDLSSSTNFSDADVIAFTKSCPNLTKLILPGAFPFDSVLAVLRSNCPQAAIYPSAMTEREWAHPTEFLAKLPPIPQEVVDFINGPRPIWPGKTSTEAHMVMPKVNKISRFINGRLVMQPWTLKNLDAFDKDTRRDPFDLNSGGTGCRKIWEEILQPTIDKPSEVGFEWIVFTKDVLPRTRIETYDNQIGIVKHWGYEMPGFLDATTALLWEKRLSDNRIYSENPEWTYTRCKESLDGRELIVGGFCLRNDNYGFTVPGVGVDYVYTGNKYPARHYSHNFIGAGGLKKF